MPCLKVAGGIQGWWLQGQCLPSGRPQEHTSVTQRLLTISFLSWRTHSRAELGGGAGRWFCQGGTLLSGARPCFGTLGHVERAAMA